ncbi:beta-propeller fold lactonase family protein, partial [Haliangium sp. UPWRP_2]|uniref:lactonase family protein n=1 Tax=Haliangium sp. UPWRP_2 TaxID=1931276 RepID=UPI0011B222E7
DNANAGNITGFQVSGNTLTALGATQPLSSMAPNIALGQIEFSRDGKVLVVTEKSTNKLDSYAVSAAGIASPPKTVAADGKSPFGFEFSSNGYLIVSNENGGTNGSAASTSYAVATDGTLSLVGTVTTGQTSSCWVAVAGNYAYVSNTKSANVSAYSVGADGKLALIAGNAGATGNGAVDLAVSSTNDYLYVLASMSHTVTIFKINTGGMLTSKATLSNLPTHAQGLVAW